MIMERSVTRSTGCELRKWLYPATLDRVGDGVFQGADGFPLRLRPDDPLGADLIDAPVDFQQMPVGVAEFHHQLHARAAFRPSRLMGI